MFNKNKSSGMFNFAVSLFVDHLFALIVAVPLTSVAGFFNRKDVFLIHFILGVLLYVVICYIDSWSRGRSDFNRSKFSKNPPNKLAGFIAGFIATLPAVVLGAFAFLTEMEIINLSFVPLDFVKAVSRFWVLPLSSVFNIVDSPYVNLILPMLLPMTSGIAYIFGIYEISLKRIFVYKSSSEDE